MSLDARLIASLTEARRLPERFCEVALEDVLESRRTNERPLLLDVFVSDVAVVELLSLLF